MSDIRYIINKEKRTVICILSKCKYVAAKRIFKYSLKWDSEYGEYFIQDYFIGKAKCAPEDTFDEEIGKRIALTRAKIKRCKAVNKMIDKALYQMEESYENLKNHGFHKVPDEPEF